MNTTALNQLWGSNETLKYGFEIEKNTNLESIFLCPCTPNTQLGFILLSLSSALMGVVSEFIKHSMASPDPALQCTGSCSYISIPGSCGSTYGSIGTGYGGNYGCVLRGNTKCIFVTIEALLTTLFDKFLGGQDQGWAGTEHRTRQTFSGNIESDFL